MLDGLRSFMLRGNVIDLGVGVVMGVAFKSVVDSFVADLLTPLIAILGGDTQFGDLLFTIRGSEFHYGLFLNVMISFVITGAVIFYAVVTPVNRLLERYREEPTPDPTTRKCPFCFSEIALHATRCSFCTSELATSAAA